MLKFIDGFKGSLLKHFQTTDDTLHITHTAINTLNDLPEGDHVYLTLRYLDRYEVVKFVKDTTLKNGKVPVVRDVLGKGRRNFPAGACVAVDWNSIQLKEFICQTKEDCQ